MPLRVCPERPRGAQAGTESVSHKARLALQSAPALLQVLSSAQACKRCLRNLRWIFISSSAEGMRWHSEKNSFIDATSKYRVGGFVGNYFLCRNNLS